MKLIKLYDTYYLNLDEVALITGDARGTIIKFRNTDYYDHLPNIPPEEVWRLICRATGPSPEREAWVELVDKP